MSGRFTYKSKKNIPSRTFRFNPDVGVRQTQIHGLNNSNNLVKPLVGHDV